MERLRGTQREKDKETNIYIKNKDIDKWNKTWQRKKDKQKDGETQRCKNRKINKQRKRRRKNKKNDTNEKTQRCQG